jgi:dTDP-4-dehydrorhamnose reductase
MLEIKRVMVTGAAGQLGSTVVASLSRRYEVASFTRAQLDIADEPAVLDRVTSVAPDAIVNCAAYNDVDRAEDTPLDAISGNALGVLALSRTAAASGTLLVHFSTDFVFDGTSDRPYDEADPPRPLSVYGSSKLLGEWFALEAPSAYVLRVESLFGGHPAKSSIDKILADIENGRPVHAFADRTVTPSYVVDVTAATMALLERQPPFGLYHCVNSDVTTWEGVAIEAASLMKKEAQIVPVASDSVKRPARRPRYCALSNRKLADAGIVMPPWRDALARYVSLSRD